MLHSEKNIHICIYTSIGDWGKGYEIMI